MIFITDKERLVELLKQAYNNYIIDNTEVEREKIADYLLKNGVLVPPCKVGDTVYYPYKYHNKVLEYKVKQLIINDKGKWLDVGVMWFSFEDVGKIVFLTREEAERVLRGERE